MQDFNKEKLQEKLHFPSFLNLKIIADKNDQIESLLEIRTKKYQKKGIITKRFSKTQKYISFSINIYFETKKDYEKLRKNLIKIPCIKHVL